MLSDMFSDPTEKNHEKGHKKKRKQNPWANYMIDENLNEIKKFEEKQKGDGDSMERGF